MSTRRTRLHWPGSTSSCRTGWGGSAATGRVLASRGGRWHAQARLALREDLYRSLRDLTIDVTRHGIDGAHATSTIRDFEAYNRPRLDRAKRTLDEFLDSAEPDLAVLSVASAQLRRLHR